MKTKIIRTALFISLFALSFGCDNNADLSGDLSQDINAKDQATQQVYPVEIQATDFSLPEGCGWKSPAKGEPDIYVIRSVEDILPLIDGEFSESLIDFEKYSLVYARGGCTSGIVDITKRLQQISGNEYLLNVNITNNILAVAPLWNIAIQVPVISQDTEIKLDILSQASDYGLKDTGYIVDSYSCTDGLKGYYIISENLKDTLIAYNLPDVYEVPSVFYDIERPEYSYRYEYKIEFVYTIAKEEDIPVCLALYPVKYPYAKQITVKSASKIADTVLPSCDIKTRFLEEVEYEVTILKTAPQKDFYSPSLCIIRGESGATLYVNEHMPVIGVICNFPQYALDWDIPEEGLPVIIKGKTYDYDKFYPADRVMYYLELSTIKKKEL